MSDPPHLIQKQLGGPTFQNTGRVEFDQHKEAALERKEEILDQSIIANTLYSLTKKGVPPSYSGVLSIEPNPLNQTLKVKFGWAKIETEPEYTDFKVAWEPAHTIYKSTAIPDDISIDELDPYLQNFEKFSPENKMELLDRMNEIYSSTETHNLSGEDIINLKLMQIAADNFGYGECMRMATSLLTEYFEDVDFDVDLMEKAANVDDPISPEEAKRQLTSRLSNFEDATNQHFEELDEKTRERQVGQFAKQYLSMMLPNISIN